MTFKAPYLTYRDVGKYAEDFLTKYHPALELPIPIEWIIEFNLGLNIVPIPYLYKTFKQSGFLSANRKIIFIDEYQYDNFVKSTDSLLRTRLATSLCMSPCMKDFPLTLSRNILNSRIYYHKANCTGMKHKVIGLQSNYWFLLPSLKNPVWIYWNQTVTSSLKYNLFRMNSGLMPRTNFPIILK